MHDHTIDLIGQGISLAFKLGLGYWGAKEVWEAITDAFKTTSK